MLRDACSERRRGSHTGHDDIAPHVFTNHTPTRNAP
jgi:hypothetical protein